MVGVGVDEMVFVIVEVLVVVGITTWHNRISNTHTEEYMSLVVVKSLGISYALREKCSRSSIKEEKSSVKRIEKVRRIVRTKEESTIKMTETPRSDTFVFNATALVYSQQHHS